MPIEKPSDTQRSRRTWILFDMAVPDELILKILDPEQ
jgi:hypothetical protein